MATHLTTNFERIKNPKRRQPLYIPSYKGRFKKTTIKMFHVEKIRIYKYSTYKFHYLLIDDTHF